MLTHAAGPSACWKSVEVMKRDLYGLRFETTQLPCHFDDGGDQIIILGYQCEEWPLPPEGKKWCEVQAGDVITETDGQTDTVISVRLYLTHGGNAGDKVVSGRNWLETGRVLEPTA